MAHRLKFGLGGLNRGVGIEPVTLRRRALLVEKVGFESLWISDHIALPGQDGLEPRLEAVVAATFLGAHTTSIRLAFGILVLPQRQPVLLAKQISSLDLLCQGRLIVGLGVGWAEAELRALGVAPGERASRFDEYHRAMLAMWDEAAPSFTGDFVSFAGVTQRPSPTQRPHPPIVIGGHSTAAMNRAVRIAHGWYGADLDLQQTADRLAALADAHQRCERPAEMERLEITIAPPGPVDLDTARRYADLGVHRLIFRPGRSGQAEIDDSINLFAENVVHGVE